MRLIRIYKKQLSFIIIVCTLTPSKEQLCRQSISCEKNPLSYNHLALSEHIKSISTDLQFFFACRQKGRPLFLELLLLAWEVHLHSPLLPIIKKPCWYFEFIYNFQAEVGRRLWACTLYNRVDISGAWFALLTCPSLMAHMCV